MLLAYNVASLLNNLFGKGKEPFWQQAYTNLIKFIILLHKVAYDYVTFFDVYECAISAPLLKERIEEAERILSAEAQIYISAEDYTSKHHTELQAFHFVFNKTRQMYHAVATSELREFLVKKQIRFSDDSDSHHGRNADPQARAVRGRREMVRTVTEPDRAQAPHVHRRGGQRVPVALRRQPTCQAHVLPAEDAVRRRSRGA